MTTFIITLGLFLFIFLVMAVGYIFQRKSISGSCGGLSTLGIEKACDCESPCEKRLAREKKMKAEKANAEISVKNI
jgi:hypothetical protein